MAALLASLPRTTSLASSTCHWRTIPFLEGNSVLIDTRLHFVASNYLEYRAERRMSNRGWAAFRPPWLVASGWWLVVLPASPRVRPQFLGSLGSFHGLLGKIMQNCIHFGILPGWWGYGNWRI